MNELNMIEELQKQVQATSLLNGQKVAHNLKAEIQKHRFDINRVPGEDDGILFIGNELVGSKGNLVCITGEAKSRKSVIAGAIASACIGNREVLNITARLNSNDVVLHLDTEQGYSDYYKTVVRMLNNAGLEDAPDNFVSIHERSFDSAARLQSLDILFQEHKPTVCIVDGVADLLIDFNNNEQTEKVMTMLMRLSLEYNALIICVIHVTRGHGGMRGALGTACTNKSQTVILVERHKDNDDASSVKAQMSRHKNFAPFDIVWDEFNLGYRAELISAPKAGRPKKEENTISIEVHAVHAMRMFVYPTMRYGQLVDAIKATYSVGDNGAKTILKELGTLGIIAKDEASKVYYIVNKS